MAVLRTLIVLCLVAGAPLAASGAGTGVCVTNGTGAAYLFVAEAGASRAVADLAPGGMLCAEDTRALTAGGMARVSVFTSRDAIEGCTRLVPVGGADRLERYADFDNCRWASHGAGE